MVRSRPPCRPVSPGRGVGILTRCACKRPPSWSESTRTSELRRSGSGSRLRWSNARLAFVRPDFVNYWREAVAGELIVGGAPALMRHGFRNTSRAFFFTRVIRNSRPTVAKFVATRRRGRVQSLKGAHFSTGLTCSLFDRSRQRCNGSQWATHVIGELLACRTDAADNRRRTAVVAPSVGG